ncbi:hypothetical protein ACWCPJ_34805 [Streptomyces collinus]
MLDHTVYSSMVRRCDVIPLTDYAEASWLLADLARAGWPATTLAPHLNVRR